LSDAGRKSDGLQQRLADYARALTYDSLTPAAAHAAKVRVIDTLAALVGGFDGEPCRIARSMAARAPLADGATVYGTATRTTPEMAAFVNATTARYAELNDVYHWPGSAGGHPSDVIMPLLGVAEHARATGHDLITAVVLAYEIYLRFSDAAVGRIADFAVRVNDRTENIGARRLHTVMERLLDEISFEGPDLRQKTVTIDEAYVDRMLADIVKNEDLSRYIL